MLFKKTLCEHPRTLRTHTHSLTHSHTQLPAQNIFRRHIACVWHLEPPSGLCRTTVSPTQKGRAKKTKASDMDAAASSSAADDAPRQGTEEGAAGSLGAPAKKPARASSPINDDETVSRTVAKARKCTNCGQQGHNKKTCKAAVAAAVGDTSPSTDVSSQVTHTASDIPMSGRTRTRTPCPSVPPRRPC